MKEQPSSAAEKPKALDTEWYKKYNEAGAVFEAYEYFDGDNATREEQRNKFQSGEIRNPHLEYPKIDKDQMITMRERLRSFKELIKKEEKNEVVKKTYTWRINEKLAEIEVVLLAIPGYVTEKAERQIDAQLKREGSANDAAKKQVLLQDFEQNKREALFTRYSQFVYGKPQADIFAYTLDELSESCKKAQASDKPEIQQAAADLLASLPPMEGRRRQVSKPTT